MQENQTTTPTTTDTSGNSFMSKIQEQLLGQSGIISSSSGSLESKISEAIKGVQAGTEASKKALESTYNRQIASDTQTAAESLTAGRAAGSGGIMNIGALRELTRTTDQHLKDLEQRKQELMLQADAAGYKQVSDLQIKALEFKQQAEQQVFANLLGMANFGMQAQQEDRLAKAQTFTERQAINNIALEFGLPVTETDTLESITSRAMKTASKQKALELARLQADISAANATAARARQGESTTAPYDKLTLSAIVGEIYKNSPDAALAEAAKYARNQEQFTQILTEYSSFRDTQKQSALDTLKTSGNNRILSEKGAREILGNGISQSDMNDILLQYNTSIPKNTGIARFNSSTNLNSIKKSAVPIPGQIISPKNISDFTSLFQR